MSLDQIEADILQQKIYDDVFKFAMDLIVQNNNKPDINQLVSSSLLAIAIRFYKTSLQDAEYLKFLNSITELSKDAKPFTFGQIIPKNKLN